MHAFLNWTGIRTDDDAAWNSRMCLYTYAVPTRWDRLYIGKAVGCTVRERYDAPDKDAFCKWAVAQGIVGFGCYVAVPQVEGHLTPTLVRNIEDVLIFGLKPRGNVQGVNSYHPHPGLTIMFGGEGTWPRELRDAGTGVRVTS